MTVELNETPMPPIRMDAVPHDNVLTIEVTGKLTHEDYEQFVPAFDKMIAAHGKVRLLFIMTDFHGWEMPALWDDLKVDFHHWNDVERIAMVGETAWQKGMALFCRPFTTAKVKYFDHTSREAAEAWINE